MTAEREPGNYHVRIGGEWRVASYRENWSVAGYAHKLRTSAFDEIGPRIYPPGEPDEAAVEHAFAVFTEHLNKQVFDPNKAPPLYFKEALSAALAAMPAAPSRDEVRNEALEECAKLADSKARDYQALYVLDGFPEDLKRKGAAESIARRIRALKSPPHQGDE